VRDPVGINSRTETAIEQVVQFLGLPARLGILDGRSPSSGPSEDFAPRDPSDFEAYLEVALLGLQGKMSKHVCDHICRVLSERNNKLPRTTKSDRNAWIAAAVETVHERGGFKCTRSHDIVKSDSACSIVTAALARLGVHIPERTVEDIWGSRDAGKVADFRQSIIILGSWFCPEK